MPATAKLYAPKVAAAAVKQRVRAKLDQLWAKKTAVRLAYLATSINGLSAPQVYGAVQRLQADGLLIRRRDKDQAGYLLIKPEADAKTPKAKPAAPAPNAPAIKLDPIVPPVAARPAATPKTLKPAKRQAAAPKRAVQPRPPKHAIVETDIPARQARDKHSPMVAYHRTEQDRRPPSTDVGPQLMGDPRPGQVIPSQMSKDDIAAHNAAFFKKLKVLPPKNLEEATGKQIGGYKGQDRR